jgi:hypothetical protein
MIYIPRNTKRSISLPALKKNGFASHIDFILEHTPGIDIVNQNITSSDGTGDVTLEFDIGAGPNAPLGFHTVTITGTPNPVNPVTINVTVTEAANG